MDKSAIDAFKARISEMWWGLDRLKGVLELLVESGELYDIKINLNDYETAFEYINEYEISDIEKFLDANEKLFYKFSHIIDFTSDQVEKFVDYLNVKSLRYETYSVLRPEFLETLDPSVIDWNKVSYNPEISYDFLLKRAEYINWDFVELERFSVDELFSLKDFFNYKNFSHVGSRKIQEFMSMLDEESRSEAYDKMYNYEEVEPKELYTGPSFSDVIFPEDVMERYNETRQRLEDAIYRDFESSSDSESE